MILVVPRRPGLPVVRLKTRRNTTTERVIKRCVKEAKVTPTSWPHPRVANPRTLNLKQTQPRAICRKRTRHLWSGSRPTSLSTPTGLPRHARRGDRRPLGPARARRVGTTWLVAPSDVERQYRSNANGLAARRKDVICRPTAWHPVLHCLLQGRAGRCMLAVRRAPRPEPSVSRFIRRPIAA